jgi:hypothetical protein
MDAANIIIMEDLFVISLTRYVRTNKAAARPGSTSIETPRAGAMATPSTETVIWASPSPVSVLQRSIIWYLVSGQQVQ